MVLNEENKDESKPNITSSDPLILMPSTSKENLVKNKPNWISRFSGIFYALSASLLFTCAVFFTKQLGVDLLDALVFRFFLQTTLTLIFALYKRYTLLGGTPWEILLQVLCSATGSGGLFLYFFAVRYIEISDVSTLVYTRVVWTIILSIIVYRERPSIGALLALPLTFLGVIFVTQPSFLFSSKSLPTNNVDNKYRLLGFALAFTCALTSAINVLLFKQLISVSKDIKPSVLNFQFSFAVFAGLTINQLYKKILLQTPTSFTYIFSWRYLLASVICLLAIGASVLTQKAIKREHPAVFSLLGSSDIIFALILQNIFTSFRSDLYALFGSTLVISSVVLIGISRIINERREQKKLKKKQLENLNEKNGNC